MRIFENLHEFNIENLLELKFRRSNKIIFVKRVRIYIEIVTLTKIIVDFIKIYFDIKKSKLLPIISPENTALTFHQEILIKIRFVQN